RSMKLLRTRRQFTFARGVLLPAHRRIIVRHPLHRNAILHRANRRAEIASHTGFLDDLHHWPTFPVSRIPSLEAPNSLVGTVLTGGPTQLALDAFVLIDVGEQVIVEIELFPLRDARQRPAAYVGQRAVAALIH